MASFEGNLIIWSTKDLFTRRNRPTFTAASILFNKIIVTDESFKDCKTTSQFSLRFNFLHDLKERRDV